MIYVVYCDDPDCSSGVSFSGIFDNKEGAESWAKSEGPEYKVATTTFGPIVWQRFSPLPPMDWNNLEGS